MNRDHPASSRLQTFTRTGGLVLALIVLINLDPGATGSVMHHLVLPVLLALAAWLILRSMLAVSLAALFLSGVHIDFSASHWLYTTAYPLICGAAGVIVLVIAASRFRAKIIDTHNRRWQSRHTRPGESEHEPPQ